MSNSYSETIETNELIVGYARGFQQTENWAYVYGIHKLLIPTTRQIVKQVIAKAGLPADLEEDMIQEAYFRLPWAILAFDYERVPVFITYWQQVYRNHLVGQYQKHWRHKDIPEKAEHPARESNPEAKLILEEIKEKLIAEILSWDDTQYARDKKIAIRLIEARIFQLKENQISQKEIAAEFNVAGGVISAWEKWARDKIKEDFGDE